MAFVDSVNIGQPKPDPWKGHKSTGIGKRPVEGPVEIRAPGPKTLGLGSGLVGDFIGDGKHHGGDSQAVYAFQREDLDYWEERLGRELPNGHFGENLTTIGLEVNEARLGERWRVGDAGRPAGGDPTDSVRDLPGLDGRSSVGRRPSPRSAGRARTSGS